MMGAAQFATMQPHAYFITTARGGIHDEAALAAALTAKQIAGAGLDVWEDEPPPSDHPLLAFDNVLVSPHTAGITRQSRHNIAKIAAEQAIACPLLEGVDLNGARGVLVNITASRSLKMRETREIMDRIRSFASEDATVIFGTAYDENMGDNLRVTVVATGLGRAQARPTLVKEPVEVVRTGTDNLPMATSPDLNVPSVLRNPRSQASAQVRALETAGMEHYDIPAFLRRQAD